MAAPSITNQTTRYCKHRWQSNGAHSYFGLRSVHWERKRASNPRPLSCVCRWTRFRHDSEVSIQAQIVERTCNCRTYFILPLVRFSEASWGKNCHHFAARSFDGSYDKTLGQIYTLKLSTTKCYSRSPLVEGGGDEQDLSKHYSTVVFFGKKIKEKGHFSWS